MSAGALFGTVMNFIMFSAFWTVIGFVFDRIAVCFNQQINLIPTMQDAVNGFTMIQVIYGVLPVIVLIVLVFNYFVAENRSQTGLV